jgi:hypothetical protein
MAFDWYRDCLDASDELHWVDKDGSILQTFGRTVLTTLHDYRCGSARSFPCDDDQKVCTTTLWSHASCQSKRDLRFIQTLLGPPDGNAGDYCWIYAVCQLDFRGFWMGNVPVSNAQCEEASLVCSTTRDEFLFPFIKEYFVAYPSVKFIYHTKLSINQSIVPDLICYNAMKCRHLFTPNIKKFDCFCNPWSEIMGNQSYRRGQWDFLIYAVRRVFARCFLPPKNLSTNSELFDCLDGSLPISKHRLHDAYTDCVNGRDEMLELDSCALGFTNRFQCRKMITRCIPRILLSNKIINCPDDKSDEDLSFPCHMSDDYGCKWKRGSLTAVNLFSFRQICDGFIDFIEKNHTDETNCPQNWIYECNSSWTRCDNYWQCRDGRDELDCDVSFLSWPTFSACTAQRQFYCINKTSRQWQCYSNKLAGNEWEDCVGGVDERIGGICQKRYRIYNQVVC